MNERTIGIVGWGVLFGAMLVWQGIALVRAEHGFPGITRLIEEAGRFGVVRWVAAGVWLWLGWHVFVRTWETIPPT